MSDATRSNNYTSEASRMLEQALEQMDGIIQGAKYELPQYFETFSLQVRPSMFLKSVVTFIVMSGLTTSKLLGFCQ